LLIFGEALGTKPVVITRVEMGAGGPSRSHAAMDRISPAMDRIDPAMDRIGPTMETIAAKRGTSRAKARVVVPPEEVVEAGLAARTFPTISLRSRKPSWTNDHRS
jgi:hypothetical protein